MIRQHLLLVKRCPRQFTCPGARGHNDLLGHQCLRRRTGHRDLVAARTSRDKCATTVKEADFVFLEQKQDAVVVLLDDRVLAAHHLGHIHTQTGHANAVIAEMVRRLLVMFRRLQQRL